MRKRNVLTALVALTGGLLLVEEGPIVAAPLLVASGVFLRRSKVVPGRERLTAAVAALGR
ncbi:hypothetical protein BRC82_07710 [Halobacteriales archaeon QS_1_67_19]|nr:MAG: hypothetical protein BRC82_07710 [Halobacteriales archaeon QS_1_67_19]